MAPESENIVHKVCSICHEEIDYYAYGVCNHPTCTKCILKLRKFGNADEPDFSKCPTCRRNINKIVLMDKFVPFDNIMTANMRHDQKYDFFFTSTDIENHYLDMLKSRCPICGEEMRSLSALNRHTSMQHNLFYCDLCIRYSRLLPCEFVPMKREDLTEHRRWDKTEKRGHPLCDFCEERFYEMEDLIRHIRDNHFLCDLCMTPGNFVVFKEQSQLLQHYEDSHYLCRECRASQRIACYATVDRLGLHRFQEHPDVVANEPDAWLPVTIQHAPVSTFIGTSSRQGRQDPNPPSGRSVSGTVDGALVAEGTEAGVRFRCPNPSEWTGEDFPSLHGLTSGADLSSSSQRGGGLTSAAVAQSSTAVSTTTTSAVTESMASRTGRGRGTKLSSNDFPSLSGLSTSTMVNSTPQWTNKAVASVPSSRKPSSDQPAPSRLAHVVKRQDKPTQNDFPSLGGSRANQGDHSVGWIPPSPAPKSSTTKAQPHTTSVPTTNEFPGLLPSGKHKKINPMSTSTLPPFTKQSQTTGKQISTKPMNPRKKNYKPEVMDNFEQQNDPMCATVKTKLRQQRNPEVRHALSQPWSDEVETQVNSGNIRTVESFPEPLRETLSTNMDPADFSASDFPTLSVKANSNKPKYTMDETAQINASKEKQSAPPKKKADLNGESWPTPPNGQIDTECILYADKTYIPMSDSATRNRDLISRIQDKLFILGGKTAFTRFADLSRRYSHRQLTAADYVEALSGLLTARSSSTDVASDPPLWIAEMLALLPDIGLQRALLRVLQGQGAPRLPNDGMSNRHRQTCKPSPVWSRPVLKLIRCCGVCGQVCLRDDMAHHTELAHSEA